MGEIISFITRTAWREGGTIRKVLAVISVLGILAGALLSMFDLAIPDWGGTGLLAASLMILLWIVSQKAIALEKAAKPQIRIFDELELRQLPRVGDTYCIKVENTGKKAIEGCLAKLVSLTDQEGTIVRDLMTLRTENQLADRPQGAFNLRPEEPKYVVFAEPVRTGNKAMKIVGADNQKQGLSGGQYTAIVKFFGQDGSPAECIIEINGTKAHMVR